MSHGLDVDVNSDLESLSDENSETDIRSNQSYNNEGLFQFLTIFSISLFIGLLLVIIQANMAWQSYQIMQQLSRKRSNSDVVYHLQDLYFDYMDWSFDLNKVDLKVNTSIFVH